MLIIIRSVYVCIVNIKLKYNFLETSRKFIIAKVAIHKPGSSSVLIIINIILALH